MKRKIIIILLLICFIGDIPLTLAQEYRYPDLAFEFLGPDKHENYNRKMFNFDLGLNKYVIRPLHILWSSIMPQYGIDRIYGISYNIEYPMRLVSSLVQKDFKNAGNETKRFFINTTIGLAGMFDPAKTFFKLEKNWDNMDKAFARRNIKSGAYFVAPVIAFTSVRDLFGRLFDIALNPSTYVGTPLVAAIKACLTINRTTYIQSVIQLVESNFADPYEVIKKGFGIDKFIKKNNYDRVSIISQLQEKTTTETKDDNHEDNDVKIAKKTQLKVSAKIIDENGEINPNDIEAIMDTELGLENVSIEPNIILENYYPQSPVVDSLRTALFLLPNVTDSIWNDLSLWNRSFSKRLKIDSVTIAEDRQPYKFRYLLQKNKSAPIAIIYPSTGDGVKASHPMMFAKLFYDAGYSVIIHGNPFQWEFVKSMPADYRPGLPSRDAYMMRASITRIIDKLQKKHKCQFGDKVVLGTSLAGIDILFMAEQESKDNTLGNTQFISICPPIDLIYSVKQVDKYTEEWLNFPDELKQKIAYTSAKIVKLYRSKDDIKFEVTHMPFTEEEAKLITCFLMHQKLSDIIFVIENAPTNKKSNIYETIYSMGYHDYMQKYIMPNSDAVDKELEHGFGLVAISDYLESANNYKIYHTKNDYLINRTQLKQLKRMAGNKLVILDNGSHMGFLYRKEFLFDLKKTIEEMKHLL